MSYVEKHLIPGESVQYETRLHWIVMLGHAVVGILLVMFAIAIPITWASLGAKTKGSSVPGAIYLVALVVFLAGGALFLAGQLRRKATEMAVTSKRVIVKTGIAERRTVEILLSRIESVAVDEPALGRLLGYGTDQACITVKDFSQSTPHCFGSAEIPPSSSEALRMTSFGKVGSSE